VLFVCLLGCGFHERRDSFEDAAPRTNSDAMLDRGVFGHNVVDLGFDGSTDGLIHVVRNGTCVPEGQRFKDVHDCRAVPGPTPHQPPGAVEATPFAEHSRLEDVDNVWVQEQLQACSCICCHSDEGIGTYRWFANFDPFWLDSADDGGLRNLASVNSRASTADLDAEMNNGFTRTIVLPSTMPQRMKAYLERKIMRRSLQP